jgi:hypothetical protein
MTVSVTSCSPRLFVVDFFPLGGEYACLHLPDLIDETSML